MPDRYDEIAAKAVEDWRNGIGTYASLKPIIASALRDQDRWYDINDPEHPAPRDGTPILAGRFDKVAPQCCVVLWDPDHPMRPWGVAILPSGYGFVEHFFTHWRPLPPPPPSGEEPTG